MPKSTSLSLFPDLNVWVALTFDGHVHHPIARHWFDRLGMDARLYFCRVTQIGLLRLLSTRAVMGEDDVMSQVEAWQEYDRWMEDVRVQFLDEPAELELEFRAFTRSAHPSPRDWADSYLASFATASGLMLVTFDQSFRGRISNLLILQA